jgi:hypothetical protein
LIKLGDKEIDYNPDFRLYITTKLSNPHYTPEVSTKATIVNFAVKEQGLEAQLLNTVVQKERPDLDKQKNELVVKVSTAALVKISSLYSAGIPTFLSSCLCLKDFLARVYRVLNLNG